MKYMKLLLMALLLLLIPVQAQAAQSCGDSLSWSITDGTLVITGSGDMTSYTTYSKVPWYSQRNNIRAVELPEGLTSISRYAFYGCSKLEEITVPDSVQDIGANAFYDCTALKQVRLGTGLSYIGSEAFFGCTGLAEIYIPAGVTEIGSYALANCTALETIEVSADNHSFSSDEAGCLFNKEQTVLLLAPSLLSGFYAIPDGVEELADEAFFECVGLTALGIPKSLNSIGNMVFYLCADLNHISYAGTAVEWGYISIYPENDYLLQAEIWHFEADSAVYHHENCVSSGMFCSVCNSFIVKDRADSGSHSYSSYEDLSCNSCDATRAVAGISMKQLPPTTYTLGQQEILTDGGILEINYTDGSVDTAALAASMVSKPDTAVPGSQTLTVSYGGKTTTYTVNVILGTPDRLEPVTLPHKLHYLTEGQIDLSGLTLTATYPFGTQTVTAQQVVMTAPDMTVPGKKTVTVWVGAASVDFEIIVHEKMLLTLDSALYPESKHNYSSGLNETQTLTWPGAERLTLTFDSKSYVEDRYDYLYVTDGQGNVLYTLTGKLYNKVLTVAGDTVSLRLATDSSGTRYGYAFASIEAEVAGHSYADGYCTVCGALQYKVAVCQQGEAVNGADTVEQAVALCAPGQYLKLYTDAVVDMTVTGELYIDLNGFDLTGTLTGGRVYGMDSTTDRYNGADAGHMELTGCTPQVFFKNDITGSVKRYLAVREGSGYSFHRFYLGITHLTLRPTTDGVGYKAVFYGDEAVVNALDTMGYTMQLGDFTPRTVQTDQIVSGKTVTLRIDHYDAARYGQTELTAVVFLQLKDGTVISSTPCTMTLRGLFEQLDIGALTQLQRSQIAAMLERHPVIRNWIIFNS